MNDASDLAASMTAMTPSAEAPTAQSRLSVNGHFWMVDNCPVCAGKHYHGKGTAGIHRCERGGADYTLLAPMTGMEQWAALYGSEA